MTLGLRSRGGTKLSFDVLTSSGDADHNAIPFCRSISDPIPHHAVSEDKPGRRKRKHRKKKQSPTSIASFPVSPMNPIAENENPYPEKASCEASTLGLSCHSYVSQTGYGGSVAFEETTSSSTGSQVSGGELRQRTVSAVGGGGSGVALSCLQETSPTLSASTSGPPLRVVEYHEIGKEDVQGSFGLKPRNELNGKLETANSLDWKQLMAHDPNSTSRKRCLVEIQCQAQRPLETKRSEREFMTQFFVCHGDVNCHASKTLDDCKEAFKHKIS